MSDPVEPITPNDNSDSDEEANDDMRDYNYHKGPLNSANLQETNSVNLNKRLSVGNNEAHLNIESQSTHSDKCFLPFQKQPPHSNTNSERYVSDEDEEAQEDLERRLLRELMHQQTFESARHKDTHKPFQTNKEDLHSVQEGSFHLNQNSIRSNPSDTNETASLSYKYYRNHSWVKQNHSRNLLNSTSDTSSNSSLSGPPSKSIKLKNRQFNSSNSTASAKHLSIYNGYICHICGQNDHHIRNCPSANNPKHTKKVKPATGLPRSWLTKISDQEIAHVDCDVYALPDGSFAILKSYIGISPVYLEKRIADRYGSVVASNITEEFRCPKCHRFFEDASIAPCCGNTFCYKCIINNKNERNETTCPGCQEIINDVNEIDSNQTLQDSINAILGVRGASVSSKVQNKRNIDPNQTVPPGTIRKVQPVLGVQPLGGRLIKKRTETNYNEEANHINKKKQIIH